jgi:filamentous hemagglutinin family protein
MNKSLLLTSFQSLLISPLIYLSLGNVQTNAQIIPDNTLGSEQSIVNPINSQRSEIEGGAIRGANLFHSFQEFNIQNGASVYFANPMGVENILSRVTGSNPSNILGTLGVLGEANLFLINPNGILFGPNARLDLRGSFFASTADSIRLGENGEFSATQPNDNALLTVNPSALFINQLPLGNRSIINQSTANGVGLQVKAGQTLGLIGGNIIIDGGILTAEQGQIELGSLGNNSTVQLNSTNNSFTLDYSAVNQYQDIQVSNGALIDVSGERGGTIQIQGQAVSLTDSSIVQSNTLGSEQGGSLTVNADRLTIREGAQIKSAIFGTGRGTHLNINTTDLEVLGLSADQTAISGIFSDVAVGSSGKSGDLTVNTEHLNMVDGGQLGGNVFGGGQGGNITVNAKTIEANGVGFFQTADPQQALLSQFLGGRFPSAILALVEPGATGNGGNININTEQLTLRNGGIIGTSTVGAGKGGDLNITANDINIIANSATGFPFSSLITSVISQLATGDGGDININTERLSVQNGAQVRSGTSGVGNSGDITVRASEIEISGSSGNGLFPSSILADVENLDSIFPGAIGSGKGGNIDIEADRLILREGGQVSTETFGSGDGGNLNISATERIEANGISPDGEFVSGLFNSLASGSSGNGGNITINTPFLSLTNGAEITASTFGSGNAGNMFIDATDITVSGAFNTNNTSASIVGGIRVDVAQGATGNGGNLTIHTDRLSLRDGTQVSTNMFGNTQGGLLQINARDIVATGISESVVSGIGSGLFPGSTGNAGDIIINTDRLSLRDGAEVAALVLGSGQGGDIEIHATEIEATGTVVAQSADPQYGQLIQLLGGRLPSGVLTSVVPGATGHGGNITINAEQISLQEGAKIGAGTFGAGNSGDLTIQATGELEIIGVGEVDFAPSTIFTSVSSGEATGNGGNGTIEAGRIILRDGGQIRAGTSGKGNSGDLSVKAAEIELTGRSREGLFASSILTSVEDFSIFAPGAIGSGNAGNLYVESDRITLTDGGEITASTFGSGNAGNILVNARDIVASGAAVVNGTVIPTGLRVDVFPGSTGNGGNLTVNTDRLTLRDGGQLSTNMFSTSETAQSGNLTVNATEIEATGVSINSPSGLITNVQGGAAGSAGRLTVNTERLSLREGAEISSLVVGTGSGGNIEINATEIEAVGSGVAEATNPVEEQVLLFLGGTFPSGILTTVLPMATGSGGNLTVNADRITLQDGAQLGSGTFGSGNSGDLRVQANEINISSLSTTQFPPSSIFTSVLGSLADGEGGNAIIAAQQINLQDGGQIRSGTSGAGNSGDLSVIAPEIQLTGTTVNGRFPSSILTEVEDFSDFAPGVMGSGDGGSLRMDSNRISITEGAAITASSFGEGAAGSMEINANSIQLNHGTISAETATGTEGNITLNTQELRLNNNSSITTNAMTEATGGNININTGVAILAEESHISANAVEGQGGNIQLNAEALFVDNHSQITASSAFGVDGSVELNAFNDFSQAVVNLPSEIIDISTLVSQNLCKPTAAEIAAGSSLVISGRGGLPPNPTEPLTALQGLVEWEAMPQQRGIREEHHPVSITESESTVIIQYPTQHRQPIRQAQGWVKTAEGQIVLTEVTPTVTPQGVQLPHPDCSS